MPNPLTTAAACLLLSPAAAMAASDIPQLDAGLIFDGGTPDSIAAAEGFQNSLDQFDGQVVWLTLELLNDAPEPANTYTVSRPGTDGDFPVCGSGGIIGLIDTMQTGLEVSFNNPSDFHAPTVVYIGDRRNYPMHSAKCDDFGYLDKEQTTLRLRGHFVVEVSGVPTGIEYTLLPIRPN